jgi:hypothetical protein
VASLIKNFSTFSDRSLLLSLYFSIMA